jgi:hypothetical protein
MKTLIVQHWMGGEPPELVQLSVKSIQSYAEKIGSEYVFLRGPVYIDLGITSAPLQKMVIINEEYDDYDVVMVTDTDMFMTTNKLQNIFTEETEIGCHTHVQDRLAKWLHNQKPNLFDPQYSYWGGSTKRLDRETRQLLRSFVREEEIPLFATRNFACDEGMMHRLATLAKIKGRYFKDLRWQYPSYKGNWKGNPKEAMLVHVRKKNDNGDRVGTKLDHYQRNVDSGFLLDASKL